MTCPSCAAPRSADHDPCPWCGAPGAAALPQPALLPVVAVCEGLGCPAGHGALQLVRLSGPLPLSLGCCPDCRGVFLGRGGLDGLLLGLDPAVLKPAGPVGAGAPCPVCGVAMARYRLAGRPGLIVEHCGEHGLWLEASELAWLQAGDGPADGPAPELELQRRLRAVLAPLVGP
ncbi:MAG: hypothetical protein VKN13_05600 [Cyanobacteriota bacterium]|nr:hypothetical protein [Cyanobacteriota bacterium]